VRVLFWKLAFWVGDRQTLRIRGKVKDTLLVHDGKGRSSSDFWGEVPVKKSCRVKNKLFE